MKKVRNKTEIIRDYSRNFKDHIIGYVRVFKVIEYFCDKFLTK